MDRPWEDAWVPPPLVPVERVAVGLGWRRFAEHEAEVIRLCGILESGLRALQIRLAQQEMEYWRKYG